jgi:hypothetical protein
MAAPEPSKAPRRVDGIWRFGHTARPAPLFLRTDLMSAAWDRFANGTLQDTGPFAHQNTFGLMSNFLTFPFLAMLLVGEPGWLPITVPIAGAIIAILTGSRATIVLTGMGYVLLFACSALRGWSSRKTKVALIGIAAAAILIRVAVSTLQVRLGGSPLLEDEEREAFERAAAMMVADHPMGVGANHHVVAANTEGYSDRAGVIPTLGSHRVFSFGGSQRRDPTGLRFRAAGGLLTVSGRVDVLDLSSSVPIWSHHRTHCWLNAAATQSGTTCHGHCGPPPVSTGYRPSAGGPRYPTFRRSKSSAASAADCASRRI